MDDFITALTATFSLDSLWTTLAVIAGFIGSMIIFAFAYRTIRKLVTGASKGKAKL